MIALVFWICCSLLLYVYLRYPALARILAGRFGQPVIRGEALPTVTVIVTAYNEEKCIRSKLDNLSKLGYHELAMRVRVAIRSLDALMRERRFLNPFRYGCFAWQLWSHKVTRYASPVLWFGALATNVVLAAERPYLVLLVGQGTLLAAGILGFVMQGRRRELGLLGQPYYFLLTNVASLIATLRYLLGQLWSPGIRSAEVGNAARIRYFSKRRIQSAALHDRDERWDRVDAEAEQRVGDARAQRLDIGAPLGDPAVAQPDAPCAGVEHRVAENHSLGGGDGGNHVASRPPATTAEGGAQRLRTLGSAHPLS